jgi:hypothetical protein
MVPAGHGHMINSASVAGLSDAGGGRAHVAFKHGVVGLTSLLPSPPAMGCRWAGAVPWRKSRRPHCFSQAPTQATSLDTHS